MHHKNKLLSHVTDKLISNKRKIFIIFVLILISFIPALLLFKPGFPATDDATWLIIRFSAFFETLRTGQIPVRFIFRLNDGMGYPASNFLYPLYLYLATPIHILGFSFLNSIKILLIANIFLSALFTFFWLNKKFGELPSFLSSLVLILSPYYLFDIYKRGSIGELLTFSIVPFILWQIERRSFIFISIGFFLLILAHNTLGILFLVFILFYALVNGVKLKVVILPLIIGIGLSAFFWIPALYDLPSTVFLNTKVSNFYGYFFRSKDFYLIGISTLFIISVSIILLFLKKQLKKNLFFTSSIVISIVLIFLQLPQSKVIWEAFPFKDFIQFPFRLLSILTILLSILVGFSAHNLSKIYFFVYSLILIAVLLTQAFLVLNKVEIQNFEDGFYSTNQSTTTISNEYLSKWYKKPVANQEKVEVISGEGKIVSSQGFPNKININVDFQSNGQLQINYTYFPGWVAHVNHLPREINYKNNGLISLNLEKGKHLISMEYKETGVHLISDLISLFSLAIFSIIIFSKRRKLKFNKLFK